MDKGKRGGLGKRRRKKRTSFSCEGSVGKKSTFIVLDYGTGSAELPLSSLAP